ncbi:MAG: MFS transporter [Xanthobacteraceae bacterium]|nr:MFS transporter [Xanthobacteraceae bacterium]
MDDHASGEQAVGAVGIERRRSRQRGRRVVIGAFGVMFVMFGIINSFSSFFASLQEAFTAQRGEIALIYSIAAPLYFLLGLVSGPLADSLGPRRVAFIGVLLGAAGLLFAAQATTLWQIYLGFGVGVGCGVGFSYVPAIAAVQRWFLKGRGTASGLAVAGIGLGTLAMPLVAAPLISWLGWRGAWSVFAVLMIVGGGGAALLLDRGPERYGWLPDGDIADPSAQHQRAAVMGWSIKDATRSRPFCLLYLGLVFASVGAFVPFVHLVPYAEDHGISQTSAIAIFGMLGIGSTAGRFAIGGLADRIGRGRSLALVFVGLTATLLWWLVATSAWQLTIFALVFGCCQGSFVALYPALTVDYFGGRNASGIIGILYTGGAIGTLAGPKLAGDAFDLFHSYSLPILVSAGCALVAAIFILLLPKPAVIHDREA